MKALSKLIVLFVFLLVCLFFFINLPNTFIELHQKKKAHVSGLYHVCIFLCFFFCLFVCVLQGEGPIRSVVLYVADARNQCDFDVQTRHWCRSGLKGSHHLQKRAH